MKRERTRLRPGTRFRNKNLRKETPSLHNTAIKCFFHHRIEYCHPDWTTMESKYALITGAMIHAQCSSILYTFPDPMAELAIHDDIWCHDSTRVFAKSLNWSFDLAVWSACLGCFSWVCYRFFPNPICTTMLRRLFCLVLTVPLRSTVYDPIHAYRLV